MLAPGFSVRELPLKLGNLNNVRYRYDGKLVALGYDGAIHLLSDTNGDGRVSVQEAVNWAAPQAVQMTKDGAHGSQHPQISGGSGDDLIKGDDGGDQLEGDSGNDTLFGGNQSDVLVGGDDNDDRGRVQIAE